MTDKDSNESSDAEGENTAKSRAAESPGAGIKSRLTEAQKEMLASKSRGSASSQSVGHSHKPTHASGKQGPAEKKVRW